MADLRPWLKLWKTAYRDPGLARLSVADQGCWMRLLLYVGLHGEGGVLVLRHGIGELRPVFSDIQCNAKAALQVSPSDTHQEPTRSPPGTHQEPTRYPPGTRQEPRLVGVRRIIGRLPGVSLKEATGPDSPMTITLTKWQKYQVDDSTGRVKKWRERQTAGNAPTPLPRNADSPLQRAPCNGVRREEKRRD